MDSPLPIKKCPVVPRDPVTTSVTAPQVAPSINRAVVETLMRSDEVRCITCPKREYNRDLNEFPEGHWDYDVDADLYFSEKEKLYFHLESRQFYDAGTQKWYNSETQCWYEIP